VGEVHNLASDSSPSLKAELETMMRKAILAALSLVGSIALAYGQNVSASDLASRAVERRAIEAMNWGMPAVNFDLMLQAATGAKGGPNQIVYWSHLFDWKNQTLTPNPDVIYVMPFFNTKDAGPMVLEIPAASDDGSITGTIMDCWQAPLEDVGPAGADKGMGGKYLILPPDYKAAVPEGYIVLSSLNYEGYALLRSILKGGSEGDLAKAVSYAQRIKFYPLAEASNPPQTKFVDAVDVVFDATIPYDLRFFQSLDRIVQIEPWLPRDKVMIDLLKSIGIEKGRAFNPDTKTQDALKEAAREAHDWFEARYDTSFETFYEGTQWVLPFVPELKDTVATLYETPNGYSVDARGLADTYAYSTIKHLGAGQFYLIAIKDKAGAAFDGSRNYRLTLPANAPVRQYWSLVAYDRATHALIRDVSRASRSSQSEGLQKNADGSVDVWLGPQPSAGKESNWIATKPGGQFELMFRAYGPEKAFFDKTWKLPDIVRAD
jgi:hypothetical protein